MKPTRVLLAAGLLWLAAACQQGLAPRTELFGAQPDFLLVVLATLSLWLGRSGGAVLGFFTGWIYGALVGANLTVYLLTRTVTGFVAGWSNDLKIQESWILAAGMGFFVTILSGFGVTFLAPHPEVAPALADTIQGAIYNGMLAIPVYALLRRILGPQTR